MILEKQKALTQRGVAMSKLYDGNWKGVPFKVRYIKKKLKNLFVFWDGDFAEFEVVFEKDEKFSDIAGLMKVYSDSTPVHLGYDEFLIDRDNFKLKIKTSTIYSKHSLEYWIGTPNFDKSVRLAKFEGSDFDKFVAGTVLPVIITSFFSCFLVFLAWALGVIKINPAWEVFLHP